MKKEEEKPKGKLESTNKEVETPKATEIPKPESKQDKPEVPAKKSKSSAKQHFADEFAREKERISGKPFKGEPNLEDAGDSGLLQKYYKIWTLSEA